MGISSLFPPSLLAESQARSVANMDATALIAAPVQVRDPLTGITATTYPVASADVPCRVAPLSANERLIADRQAETADAVVILPINTSLGHDYRITVAGETNGVAWSQVYDVVGIESPRSYEVERRVRVETVRTGAV